MGRRNSIIAAILLIPSLCFAGGPAMHQLQRGIVAASVGTDYTVNVNCMGAWFMNNNGGDEIDRSGESGTLTHSSAPPTSATVPSGYSGTSRDFELTDPDYLYHADGLSTDIQGADQAISFGAWVRPESITQDMAIVAKGSAGSDSQYFLRYDTSSNNYICALSDSPSSFAGYAQSATGATAGVWQHVACVYNDTDIRIYINGSLDSNGADNPFAYTSGIQTTNTTGAFNVGSRSNSIHYDGLIDEPFIFNDALSAAEVLEIDTSGMSGNKGGSD